MTTDLYNDEGALDYAEAARRLRSLREHGRDMGARAETIALVTAAAQLDIAVSLSAIVTGLATGGLWLDDERQTGPDGEPMGDPERGDGTPDEQPLEVGDWVLPRDREPDEFTGPFSIAAIGVSEGRDIATLGNGNKVWLDLLERVAAPERETDPEGFDLDTPDLDELPEGDLEPDAEDDDPPSGRDMVDDIDADFDPAPTPVERPRCGAAHPDIEGVTCARKPHDEGKHRKGNLKWA